MWSSLFEPCHIEIIGGKFAWKLYDKRDSFNFHIVRMPYLDSNIPEFIFHGSAFSEFLRIGRCSSDIHSFIVTAHKLFLRMKNQGGSEVKILRLVDKVQTRYPEVVNKFRHTIGNIKSWIRLGRM